MKKVLRLSSQKLALLIGVGVLAVGMFTNQKSEARDAASDYSPSAPTSALPASTLSGAWNCNDGGIYFISQVGDQLWWYGQSSDGGATWSNVFHGRIRGNQVTGRWADVPKGQIRGSGAMTLSIDSANRLVKTGGGEILVEMYGVVSDRVIQLFDRNFDHQEVNKTLLF